MGDVVLIDDLHDQCSPTDRHQGGVAGGHVDRDGHRLIERRGADAQGVAAWRQDDPSAVRAGADLLLTLEDKGFWFVDPIRHRRHEQGAHAGRHDRRVSGELFCGVGEVHRYSVCATSGGCWAAVCDAVASRIAAAAASACHGLNSQNVLRLVIESPPLVCWRLGCDGP